MINKINIHRKGIHCVYWCMFKRVKKAVGQIKMIQQLDFVYVDTDNIIEQI